MLLIEKKQKVEAETTFSRIGTLSSDLTIFACIKLKLGTKFRWLLIRNSNVQVPLETTNFSNYKILLKAGFICQ